MQALPTRASVRQPMPIPGAKRKQGLPPLVPYCPLCSLTKTSAQHLGRVPLGVVAHPRLKTFFAYNVKFLRVAYMAFPNLDPACLSTAFLASTTPPSPPSTPLSKHPPCSTHNYTSSSSWNTHCLCTCCPLSKVLFQLVHQ